MPYDRSRYPQDWDAISRRIRDREGNRCKWCGANNGEPHPVTGSRVVLTCAHLHDHDPQNCADDNLVALCQRCHLGHDLERHLAAAAKTRRFKRALAHAAAGQRDLFPPEPDVAEYLREKYPLLTVEAPGAD